MGCSGSKNGSEATAAASATPYYQIQQPAPGKTLLEAQSPLPSPKSPLPSPKSPLSSPKPFTPEETYRKSTEKQPQSAEELQFEINCRRATAEQRGKAAPAPKQAAFEPAASNAVAAKVPAADANRSRNGVAAVRRTRSKEVPVHEALDIVALRSEDDMPACEEQYEEEGTEPFIMPTPRKKSLFGCFNLDLDTKFNLDLDTKRDERGVELDVFELPVEALEDLHGAMEEAMMARYQKTDASKRLLQSTMCGECRPGCP